MTFFLHYPSLNLLKTYFSVYILNYGKTDFCLIFQNIWTYWVCGFKYRLTVCSECRQDGCSNQLLHRWLQSSLSIDQPGSLRQTAGKLIVSSWTFKEELVQVSSSVKKMQKNVVNVCFTSNKNRNMETLNILGYAVAAGRSWRTRVVSRTGKQNLILSISNTAFKIFLFQCCLLQELGIRNFFQSFNHSHAGEHRLQKRNSTQVKSVLLKNTILMENSSYGHGSANLLRAEMGFR